MIYRTKTRRPYEAPTLTLIRTYVMVASLTTWSTDRSFARRAIDELAAHAERERKSERRWVRVGIAVAWTLFAAAVSVVVRR